MVEEDVVIETYETPVVNVDVALPEGSPLLDRHAHPAYEPMVTPRFAKYIDEDTVVYDVGSRFGVYALLALELGAKGENIHTFELRHKPFQVLEDYAGSRIDNMNHIRVGSGNNGMKLDSYVYTEKRHSPDVIKMDIEGAEYHAIKGAEKILREKNPILFIEIHPWRLRDNFDSHPKDVIKALDSMGYSTMELCIRQRTPGQNWVNARGYSFDMSDNDHMLFAEAKDG